MVLPSPKLSVFAFLLYFTGFSQEPKTEEIYPEHKERIQSFYFIGDTGHQPAGEEMPALEALNSLLESQQPEKNSFLIFLGDNLPAQGELPWQDTRSGIANFGGKILFLPGELEWSRGGIEGLEETADFLKEHFEEEEVLVPNPGCGLSSIDISEEVHLIVLDSEWFLEDWDDHPLINDDCEEIKTREAMLLEVETELKKNQNKTTIIALHHPLRSFGVHGGHFGGSFYLKPEMRKWPVPIVGQVNNLIRTSGGTSPEDAGNPQYRTFIDRMETIANKWGRVIFASGHEHSLQYIVDGHIRQIVAGSGTRTSYVRHGKNIRFGKEAEGFAVLDIFEDGSSWIRFYGEEEENPDLLYQQQVFGPDEAFELSGLPEEFPQQVEASIYRKGETDKSKFYVTLWGERYRDLYERKLEVPVAFLDTLYGGLEPMRMGGGNQTNSLRVKDSLGREYNFRMLRKDAVQFLQNTAYKKKLVEEAFDSTFAEKMIQDFYTASHPFAFMAVPRLSEAAGVLHTNPELFYLPKQKALGDYNTAHGNALYMIEERPEEHWLGYESFGSRNHDIVSTADLFERLRRDEKYSLDEEAYIRARVFDMFIGDWDRHNDQWRWAEIEQENGDRIFKPIPRDRDQAFSNFDGSVFNTLGAIIGFFNQFGRYGPEISDVEWFNRSALNLDRALLQNSGKQVWKEQVEYLQKQVTDEVIREAFSQLPDEVQGETTETLIRKTRARRANLENIVERYYEYLSEVSLMTGTDKGDFIDVIRESNGNTLVQIFRNKDGERAEIVKEREFFPEETREVWVYGLDDEDIFSVEGDRQEEIEVKFIGGQNNDIYDISQGAGVKIYDHRTMPNTIKEVDGAKVYRTDNYEVNLFNRDQKISRKGSPLPYLGYNPDDGLILGSSYTYTVENLVRKPFTTRHSLRAGYFLGTGGFEVEYSGEFAHPQRKYNIFVGANYSSSRNAINFFGIGNETTYDKDFSKDYHRVRIGTYGAEMGLVRRNLYGSTIRFKLLLEGLRVEPTDNRYLTDTYSLAEDFFDRKYFAGAEAEYTYESVDDLLNPARGLYFELIGGVKGGFGEFDNSFLYMDPYLELFTPLTTDERLVLNPRLKAELRLLGNYEFYHAAHLGGKTGLRSFRQERFTGDQAFVAGTDLRYTFKAIENNFLPLGLGVLAGYDLGRVWVDGQDSDQWHQSYGGGFWISVAQAASGEVGLFHGKDGLRFTFGFQFGL